ncbi:MAG: hypothetical protein ACQEVA_08045 [Myxococcota bacterium]
MSNATGRSRRAGWLNCQRWLPSYEDFDVRRFLTMICMLTLFTGCSDDSRGGPWSISNDGDSGVSDDSAEDSGPMGPEFIGEARLLATALERVAVVARDQHSSLCVFVVLVSPGRLDVYENVRMPEQWGVESIVARPEGCPDEDWPARDGLQPDAASGRIDVYQEMSADRYTSVGVDLTLDFPDNEQREVPRQIVLDFPRLEL